MSSSHLKYKCARTPAPPAFQTPTLEACGTELLVCCLLVCRHLEQALLHHGAPRRAAALLGEPQAPEPIPPTPPPPPRRPQPEPRSGLSERQAGCWGLGPASPRERAVPHPALCVQGQRRSWSSFPMMLVLLNLQKCSMRKYW